LEVRGARGSGKSTLIYQYFAEKVVDRPVLFFNAATEATLESTVKSILHSKFHVSMDDISKYTLPEALLQIQTKLIESEQKYVAVVQNYSMDAISNVSEMFCGQKHIVVVETHSSTPLLPNNVDLRGFSLEESMQLIPRNMSCSLSKDDMQMLRDRIGTLPLDLLLAMNTMEKQQWSATQYLEKYAQWDQKYIDSFVPPGEKSRFTQMQLFFDNASTDTQEEILTLACLDLSSCIPIEWCSSDVRAIMSNFVKSEVFYPVCSLQAPLEYLLLNQDRDTEKRVMNRCVRILLKYSDTAVELPQFQHLSHFQTLIERSRMSPNEKLRLNLRVQNKRNNLLIKSKNISFSDLERHVAFVKSEFGTSSEEYAYALSTWCSAITTMVPSQKPRIEEIISTHASEWLQKEDLTTEQSFFLTQYGNSLGRDHPLFTTIGDHISRCGSDKDRGTWFYNLGVGYYKSYRETGDATYLQHAKVNFEKAYDYRRELSGAHATYKGRVLLDLARTELHLGETTHPFTLLREAIASFEAAGFTEQGDLCRQDHILLRYALTLLYLNHPVWNFRKINKLCSCEDPWSKKFLAARKKRLHSSMQETVRMMDNVQTENLLDSL